MQVETITSRQNSLMTHLRKLASSRAYREEKGEYLCDGIKLLDEALKWNAPIRTAVFADGVEIPPLPDGVRAVRVSRELMRSVSPMETPQGALFTVALPERKLPRQLTDRHYLVLDGVQDPGNVGTIWRTADAAGFQALLIGSGSADMLSPKVQRAAMGSGFRIPYCAADDLAGALKELRKNGYRVIASDLHGACFYDRPDMGEKFVLVIGNEARGISQPVFAQADVRLKLPMRGGAESLNAAVAAGIMMYELMKGK